MSQRPSTGARAADRPGDPRAEDSLEALLMAEHQPIENSFRAHRLALMSADLGEARRLYGSFLRHLRSHLEFEESHVLPVYARLWDGSNDSPPKQFELEHDKLRDLSGRLERRLAALPDTEVDRLELLDAQNALRSLIEHHDLREGRILYPFLTERLDPEIAEQIRAQFEQIRTDQDFGGDPGRLLKK